MKTYRFTVLAFAALATMTFCACSSESDLNTAVVQTPENVNPTIVFKLTAPAGSPVHYTRAVGDPFKDTDAEAAINDLVMYEFDAATGVLKSVKDITSTATADPTTANGGIQSGSSSKDFVYKYTPQGNITHNDARQFLFVANYPSLASAVTAETTTLSQVRDMITTALSGTGLHQKSVWNTIPIDPSDPSITEDYIPMTAFAMLNKSDVIPMKEIVTGGTNVVETTVNLTRIVARIDVVNNTPHLIINDIILVKANNESYLLPKTDNTTGDVSIPSSDANYAKVSMTFDKNKVMTPASSANPYLDEYETTPGTPDYLATFEIPLDANHVDMTNMANITYTGNVVKKHVTLEQAFYVYEDIKRDNVAGEAPADALHLQVRGTLNGIAVSYNIPFTKDLLDTGASTDKDGFAIKRNNLYTVVLGDGKKSPVHTEVQAKIRVTDWSQQVVTDYFDASVFKIYAETVDNSVNNSTAVNDPDAAMTISTKTITVEQGTGTDLKFVIASPYSEVSNVVATVQSLDGSALTHTWVEITPLDGTGTPATPTAANKGYLVKVQPNTDGTPEVRSAAIKIEWQVTPSGGTLTPQTPITYTLVQKNS